jgi:hypothetical protein
MWMRHRLRLRTFPPIGLRRVCPLSSTHASELVQFEVPQLFYRITCLLRKRFSMMNRKTRKKKSTTNRLFCTPFYASRRMSFLSMIFLPLPSSHLSLYECIRTAVIRSMLVLCTTFDSESRGPQL